MKIHCLRACILLTIFIASCKKDSMQVDPEINGTVSSWVAVPELAGRDIASLAASNSSIVAVGRYVDSLYRSTDRGKTWVPVPLTIGSSAPSVYASNDILTVTYPRLQISTDNGNSWNDVTNKFIGRVRKLSVNTSAAVNNILFAGMEEDGIFTSADYGQTWIAASNGLSSHLVYTMAEQGTKMFAGTIASVEDGVRKNGGLFVSSTNGTLWTSLGIPGTSVSIYAFAVHDNFIVASLMGDSSIYRSADNGATWTRAVTGQLYECTSLAILGDNVFAGCWGDGIFGSTDRGASWSSYTSDLPSLSISSIALSDSTIFVGTKHGVWKRKLVM
jgi:photosystem II stability/assembly factor-like uncharacterized protein